MTPARAHYTVLAGGTGAAKFLRGLVQVIPEEDIHVIVNVGDDTEIWGLHISPDIDSITYGLAKKLDTVRGWGLQDETFRCLEEIRQYGLPSWFRLGDRDLATHLARTEFLKRGLTLTETVVRSITSRTAPSTTNSSGSRAPVADEWKPTMMSPSRASTLTGRPKRSM